MVKSSSFSKRLAVAGPMRGKEETGFSRSAKLKAFGVIQTVWLEGGQEWEQRSKNQSDGGDGDDDGPDFLTAVSESHCCLISNHLRPTLRIPLIFEKG